MTKLKLRPFVIPTVFIVLIISIATITSIVSKYKSTLDNNNFDFTVNSLEEDITPVLSEQENKIVVKPFIDDDIKVLVDYYSKDDSEDIQKKSLINYNNVYLQNSGILYGKDSKFDVVTVLDGKVSDIHEDDILGKVIEIQHDNGIVSMYYSIDDVKVNTGDRLIQGDIIASSGKNYLNSNNENVLLFEVYKDGVIVDPDDFYNMNIDELE